MPPSSGSLFELHLCVRARKPLASSRHMSHILVVNLKTYQFYNISKCTWTEQVFNGLLINNVGKQSDTIVFSLLASMFVGLFLLVLYNFLKSILKLISVNSYPR